MKFNVNLFVGLAFCVVVLGLFGVFQRVLEIRESWRSDDLYTAAKHSTYSVATSSTGWHTSNNSGVSAISVRSANSMFRHRPVFSYAPASAPAYSQSPIANSQSPIANRQGLYTTSRAEVRSFGGGGNGGGVSMSGGVATSSGAASAAGLTTTMPSTSMYAYSNDRNPSSVATNDWMSSVFGGIAMASTSSYAGIGQTTGGSSRAVAGRHNVPGVGGNQYYGWLTSDWNEELGKGWGYSSGGGVTLAELQELFYNMTGQTHFENPQAWEAFLNWFKSQMNADGKVVFGDYTWYLPLSDAIPFVLLLCLLYALGIYRKTRKRVV